jgi:hypothetical protein
MVLSAISSPAYAAPQSWPVPQQQAPYTTFGAAVSPAGASPIPGSSWPADDAVWVAQSSEMSFLDRVHVSDVAQRMISRSSGQWEIQSHMVRSLELTQNSLERDALSARVRTRSAVNSLLAMQSRLAGSGVSVDVYA